MLPEVHMVNQLVVSLQETSSISLLALAPLVFYSTPTGLH